MYQMREKQRRPQSKNAAAAAFSLIIHRAARALVYIIYPESDSRKQQLFRHPTPFCLFCRFHHLWLTRGRAKTNRDLLRRSLNHKTSAVATAAERQRAGRRNKAQKKWTGAWRSLRPRRAAAEAESTCSLPLCSLRRQSLCHYTNTRDGIPDGQVRTARPRAKKDYPCVIITYT
jgi:hypothetical protein